VDARRAAAGRTARLPPLRRSQEDQAGDDRPRAAERHHRLADGKTLYVADIKAGKTYAYDIQKNGMLAGKRLHAALGSDGMTLDEEGNLYLTGKGVHVFDKTGKEIQVFEIPEDWTANVSFGGADHRTSSSPPARASTPSGSG
jgi:sugar lactone lactonase YvrE